MAQREYSAGQLINSCRTEKKQDRLKSEPFFEIMTEKCAGDRSYGQVIHEYHFKINLGERTSDHGKTQTPRRPHSNGPMGSDVRQGNKPRDPRKAAALKDRDTLLKSKGQECGRCNCSDRISEISDHYR